MEQAEVVVSRLPGTDRQVRTGTLLARQGSIMKVRWDDDGTEEDVRISGTATFVTRGSVRHQGWVDGEGLAARLEKDPVSVFVQLLSEYGTAMNAAKIKEKFAGLSVDMDLVDRAWGRAQGKLRKTPGVWVRGKTYVWKGGEGPRANTSPDAADSENAVAARDGGKETSSGAFAGESGETTGGHEPSEQDASEPVAAAAEQTEEVTHSSPTEEQKAPSEDFPADGMEGVASPGFGDPSPLGAPSADADEDEVGSADGAETGLAEAGSGGAVAVSGDAAIAPLAAEGPLSLAQAVATALRDGLVPDVRTYPNSVLATAVRLAGLSDGDLDHLLSSVAEEERSQAIALLAALPRKAKPVTTEDLAAVSHETARTILAASIVELRRRPPAGPEPVAAAGWLLRRVAGLPLEPEDLPPFIALAAEVAAVDEGKKQQEALERVAVALHDRLSGLPSARRSLIDLQPLARIAAVLPFTRQGGRAALLAAVARVWPEQISDQMWWREVTLTALIDCAGGLLGGVTALPAVAEEIIAPLMARELGRTTSRVRLAGLLALPHEFVVRLPAEVVAGAFRRVAVDDPIVGSWLGALSAADEIAKLRADAEQAQTETQLANERTERADARVRELAARCEQLELLLRQQHERAVGMRAAQERQVQIDAVRALADLASEVEELTASKATPEVLVERVRALVAGQDLEPIGEAGAESPFDPASHEVLVGAAQLGEAVTVLRPGYRWRPGAEETLLTRALVSVPEE